MYTIAYTYGMKQKKKTRSSKEQFLNQVEALWPALKGSLAQVRKPCIRPTCPACASGKKHPAFLLSFTQNGRRRCRYVPQALVPQLTKAIEEGNSGRAFDGFLQKPFTQAELMLVIRRVLGETGSGA